MSVQKQYTKSAFASFCPAAPLIVVGTAQWGVDDAFSSQQPSLEVLSLDLMKQGLELPRVGSSITLPASLSCLAWGSHGIASRQCKFGIIAGSLATGEVALYDPMPMVNSKGQQQPNATIHSWKPSESSKVNTLTFNPKTPNILGLGTAAGEVMVYDIANPRTPKQGFGEDAVATYKPQFRGGGACPEVLAARFNPLAERIMAVGFANGVAQIYDSRKQRAVMELSDATSPRRVSGVAWAPSVQTNLVLASDDDRSPTLQFWDLRKKDSAMLEYVGHSRGVTDVAWSTYEPNLLLSSGKDQSTIVWDAQSGDRLGSLDCYEPGPSIQVAWSPINPGTFLTCQAGQAVHIASATGVACTVEAHVDPSTGAEASYRISRPLHTAPKWLRRPCAARFGWGGKLATVRPPGGRDSTRAVVVSEVAPEPQLKAHSEQFEAAMEGDLRSYCAQKAAAEVEAEADYWGFIEVLLEGQNLEAAMLARLGFEAEVASLHNGAIGASDQVESAAALLQGHAAESDGGGLTPSATPSARGAANATDDNFFDRTGGTPRGGSSSATAAAANGGADLDGDDFFTKLGEGNTGQLRTVHSTMQSDSGALEPHDGGGGEAEAEVQRFLFVGNHSAAVEACLAAERYADALVLAHVSGSAPLWTDALARYMKACPHPYLRVVDSQMRDDYEKLIKQRSLSKWAETLAILLTYAKADFPRLCGALADRLQRSGNTHAATVCHICAANVGAAVQLWLHESHAASAAPPLPALQRVLEKSIALGLAARDASAAHNAALADLIANYALQLAGQGALGSALKYLVIPEQGGGSGADAAPTLAVLKERVYNAAPQEQVAHIEAPHFPFEYVDVPVSDEGFHAQQAAYDLYNAQFQAQQAQQAQAQTPQASNNHTNNNNNNNNFGQQQGAYGSQQYSQTGYAQPQQLQQAPSYQQHGAYAQQPPQQQQHHQQYGQQAPAPTYQPQAPAAQYQPQQQAQYQPQHYAPPQAISSQRSQPVSPGYAGGGASAYEKNRYRVDGNYHNAPQRQQSTASRPTFQPVDASPPPQAPAQSYAAPPPQFAPQAVATPVPTPAAPVAPTKPFSGATSRPAAAQHAPQASGGPPPSTGGGGYGAAPQQFQPQNVAPPGGPPPQMPQQHQATPAAPPQPPPPPPGPPADVSVYNVDTSACGGQEAGIVNALYELYQVCEPLRQQDEKHARQMDDIAAKLGALFWQLNAQQLSGAVVQQLAELGGAVQRAAWAEAQQVHIRLAGSHWDEAGQWLQALKRLIKARQAFQ